MMCRHPVREEGSDQQIVTYLGMAGLNPIDFVLVSAAVQTRVHLDSRGCFLEGYEP